MRSIRIRNKNAILELLKADINFQKIILAKNLKQNDLIKEIISTAKEKGVPIEMLSSEKMAKRKGGDSREAIFGFLIPNNTWDIDDLLENLYTNNKNPFFLLLNRGGYENNLGDIARTAFAAGVNGLIFQGSEDGFLNEETINLSSGAIVRIPIVKMSIFKAIEKLQKNGISVFSLEMSGKTYFDQDLTGPMAFVLGAEKQGLSDTVLDRCDKKISIPMQKGIGSLNVSSAAAAAMYEKVRQESK